MLQELRAAPDVVEDAGRYDRIGRLSGGTWRSRIFGYLPATVITSQQGSKWMLQQEISGNIYQKWPKTFVAILGEKALNNLDAQPELHAISRKPYNEALSPKAVLELQPYLDAIVERKILELEGFAKSGQEVVIEDEMMGIALGSISGVFFGDYASFEFMKDMKRLLPALSSGLFGVLPVRLPWPLHQLPLLRFGKAMDAREVLRKNILNVLEERRADLASVENSSTGGKNAGLLDSLMELQQDQVGTNAEQDGSFDDDFIADNVFLSLFAGTDSSAVSITRVLQLLATAVDGKDIVAELIQELRGDAKSDEDELDDTTGTGSGGASRAGILGAFPLLDAIILEAYRDTNDIGRVEAATE
eukprot:g5752.t1